MNTRTRDIVIIAVVAALLMAVGWYVHGLGGDKVGKKLGGASAVTQLALDPGEDQGLVNENGVYVEGAMSASVGGNVGTSTAAWLNTTGKNIWVSVEWAITPTSGYAYASSTVYFEVATSTTRDVPTRSFFANPSIVARTIIATGTGPMYRSSPSQAGGALATTTSEEFGKLYAAGGSVIGTTTADQALAYQRYNSAQSSIRSLGWVLLRPNEYVIVHVLDNSVTTANSGISVCNATAMRGGVTGYMQCENATSTNLGIKIDYTLLYRATTTLPE